MKKTISIVLSLCLLLSVIAFVFSNNTKAYAAAKTENKEITGSWSATEDGGIVFQFRANGTGIYTDCYDLIQFKYTFDSDTHSLKLKDKEEYFIDREFKCYICGNGMILAEIYSYDDEEEDPDVTISIYKKM